MSSAVFVIVLVLAGGLVSALFYIARLNGRLANASRTSSVVSAPTRNPREAIATAQQAPKGAPARTGPAVDHVLAIGLVAATFLLLLGQVAGLAPDLTAISGVLAMTLVSVALARQGGEPTSSLAATVVGLAPLSVLQIVPEMAMLLSLVLAGAMSAALSGRALRIVSLSTLLWPAAWFWMTWDAPNAAFTASWLFAQTIMLTIFHPDKPGIGRTETSIVTDMTQPGYLWAAPWFVLLCHQTGYDPTATVALLVYALAPLVYGLAGLDSRSMRLCALIALPLGLLFWPLGGSSPVAGHAPLLAMAAGLAIAVMGGVTIILRHTAATREWAIQGAALPVILITIAVAKTDADSQSIWLVALWLITALMMAGTARSLSFSEQRDPLPATFYAMSAGAAFSLALASVVPLTWSAMTSAILATAVAWLWRSSRYEGLRLVTLVVAGLALLHSVFATGDFDSARAMSSLQSEALARSIWLFYVFALPAWFLWAAGRILDAEEPDIVSSLILACAMLACVALAGTVLRMAFGSSFDGARASIEETTIVSLWWAFAAAALLGLAAAIGHSAATYPVISPEAAILAARAAILVAVMLSLAASLDAIITGASLLMSAAPAAAMILVAMLGRSLGRGLRVGVGAAAALVCLGVAWQSLGALGAV